MATASKKKDDSSSANSGNESPELLSTASVGTTPTSPSNPNPILPDNTAIRRSAPPPIKNEANGVKETVYSKLSQNNENRAKAEERKKQFDNEFKNSQLFVPLKDWCVEKNIEPSIMKRLLRKHGLPIPQLGDFTGASPIHLEQAFSAEITRQSYRQIEKRALDDERNKESRELSAQIKELKDKNRGQKENNKTN